MIRELLTPEAQTDAYVWAAVLVAHAGIGVAVLVLLASGPVRHPWIAAGLASLAYAALEALQAILSGTLLLWDSALDWSAVTLGAVLALGIIAAAGAWVRRGRK